jgi:hydroxypyruvate reductase
VPRSPAQLRDDALAIWQAGVDAVRSDRLVQDNVRIDGDWLLIGGDSSADALRLPLSSISKIAVVGAGKAGAGMATGLEQALGPRVLREKQVSGWINVPADCIPSDTNRKRGIDAAGSFIHLHAARPAGVNEPTAEGVAGAERILEIASSLGPSDLCFCLISGGGSALLPAPVADVSLAEKQAVTRLLSSGGANIEELNTVRKQLSRIKGGGLARACRAGRLITLIISDVLGDPLDVIASGPTVSDTRTPADALAILQRYAGGDERAAPAAFAYLRQQASIGVATSPAAVALGREANHASKVGTAVTNLVIGNNAVAVDAAGLEAERRGYSHAMVAATSLEGAAEDVGVHLGQLALQMQSESGPDCLITGGEPTVKLAPPHLRGKGGRNQQLVLAALVSLLPSISQSLPLTLLSGGTDGEDGPTDAAGAILDSETIARMRAANLDPADYLRRNDAYSFFNAIGGLIKTGPTHTNVCDVRVVVVDRMQSAPSS